MIIEVGTKVLIQNFTNSSRAHFFSADADAPIWVTIEEVCENDYRVSYEGNDYPQWIVDGDILDEDEPESENERDWYATAPALYHRREQLNTGGY